METQTDPFTERLNLLLRGLQKIDLEHSNPLRQLRRLITVTKNFGSSLLEAELTTLERDHLQNTSRYEELSSLRDMLTIILSLSEGFGKMEVSLAERILHGHVEPMIGIIKRLG